jgi:hypothetical protein
MLTLVFGLSSNLGKQLNEVRQIIAKELGSNDETFACVRREKLGTEKFRLALYPKCRPVFSRLCILVSPDSKPRRRLFLTLNA